jgi:prevent-host-death family protein
MEIVNIHQAKMQLSKLIEKVLSGKEVIIARAGKPMVRRQPIHGKLKKRVGG